MIVRTRVRTTPLAAPVLAVLLAVLTAMMLTGCGSSAPSRTETSGPSTSGPAAGSASVSSAAEPAQTLDEALGCAANGIVQAVSFSGPTETAAVEAFLAGVTPQAGYRVVRWRVLPGDDPAIVATYLVFRGTAGYGSLDVRRGADRYVAGLDRLCVSGD